jgi:biopolymer transport protein ExbB
MRHTLAPGTRRTVLLIACLTALLLSVAFSPVLPAARAQEPAGNGDNGAAAAAPAAPTTDTTSAPKQSMFMHIVKSVGWVFGFILLFISIGMVALVVLLAMELRMGAAIPPGFVEDFTDTVNKRQFKQAYEMARDDGSFLARVLTTGMSRLQYGIEDAREAAFAMVESIKAGKEQLIAYLATIGTLGPMLGLVGTVWGMIGAFRTLGAPGTTPDPAKLAENIAHALSVTLLGIGLSVPAIFCHAFFRNRLIRISMDTSNVADDLLTQMYHNSKKPAAAAAAPVVNPAEVADARAATASIKPK